MAIKLTGEKIQKGDFIEVGSVRVEVKEVYGQNFFFDDGYMVEFVDTKGVYRNWKQHKDGGNAYR